MNRKPIPIFYDADPNGKIVYVIKCIKCGAIFRNTTGDKNLAVHKDPNTGYFCNSIGKIITIEGITKNI
jgi:hypothetical protein